MKKSDARLVMQLLDRSTTELLRSMRRVQRLCGPTAAGLYAGYVGSLLGEISTRFVFHLWDEHPDLEPPSQPGVDYYNPRSADMPRAEVLRAARVLLKTGEWLDELGRLLAASEMTRAQRTLLRDNLAVLRRQLSQALFNLRQQHRDYWGPNPKVDLIADARRAPRPRPKRTRRAV